MKQSDKIPFTLIKRGFNTVKNFFFVISRRWEKTCTEQRSPGYRDLTQALYPKDVAFSKVTGADNHEQTQHDNMSWKCTNAQIGAQMFHS